MKEHLKYYSKSDRTRECYRKHAAKPRTKANRRAAKNDAFQKGRVDKSRAQARGLDYGAAIGYSTTMTNQVLATEPQNTATAQHSIEPSTQLVCKRCGQHGHRDARCNSMHTPKWEKKTKSRVLVWSLLTSFGLPLCCWPDVRYSPSFGPKP